MPTSRAFDKIANRQTWFNARAAGPRGKAQARLAARFESFADTIQTRLDTTNGTGPTLTGSLEAQVGRALSQVLRQAPADGPSVAAGQALTQPVYQAQPVSQALSVATLASGMGGPPAIAPNQAALLQEATLVKGDMLSVLDTLQPLSSFPDPSDVEAVTAVLRAEVTMLVEELSRTTLQPRSQRVRVLLGGLLGWDPTNPQTPPNSGDVGALLTLLNLGGPIVPTLFVDQQIASQRILTSDAGQFLSQWLAYQAQEPGIPLPWDPTLKTHLSGGLGNLAPAAGTPPTLALGPPSAQAQFRTAVIRPGSSPQPTPAQLSPTYAERLIQADLLLPVVGQDASRVAGALDAIGLSQGEQETNYVTLESLVDMDLLPVQAPPPPAPPPTGSFIVVRTTVTDILDWTASMADAKALDLLRQAGQLGLNLIADQADELFWLIIALLQPPVPANAPLGTPPAPQTQMVELGDVQVQTELLTLARDLNLLANLAV
jgi:hypothetical protein